MRLSPVLALALLAFASPVPAATTRQCTDPCLEAARGMAKDCASSAGGAFQDALDGCFERDHTCVDACRAVQQDCRDTTTVGAALAVCQVELVAAKARCRSGLPVGSFSHATCAYETAAVGSRGDILRLGACIFRAEVQGFRCRRHAFRRARRELRACRTGFRQCARACGPGGPPGGAGTCTGEAKGDFRSVLAGCRQAHRATASACIDKDLTCTQSCIDARGTCSAPTQAVLGAALASCTSAAVSAMAACAALPGGSPEFNQCVENVQANATTCRDAALAAAAPGLAACGEQYVACVHACPAA
jgi:hypothetical protein